MARKSSGSLKLLGEGVRRPVFHRGGGGPSAPARRLKEAESSPPGNTLSKRGFAATGCLGQLAHLKSFRSRTNAIMETLWGLGRAVLVGLLLAVLLLRLVEDRLVFFPDLFSEDVDLARAGVPVEDVFFATAHGLRLHRWLS